MEIVRDLSRAITQAEPEWLNQTGKRNHGRYPYSLEYLENGREEWQEWQFDKVKLLRTSGIQDIQKYKEIRRDKEEQGGLDDAWIKVFFP